MTATRALLGILVPVALAVAQPGGPLEGKVLNSATGRPAAGAAVVLQGLDVTGSPPQADSYVVETDANGAFKVDEIAAGRYEARAERDGFTAQPRGAAAKLPSVTVESGQPVRDVILKLIPLGAISGRVVDADGDPVSHSIVAAQGYSYATGKKELKEFARGFSNDRGEFLIANLPAGRYYLLFSPGPMSVRSTMSGMKVLGPKPAFEFTSTYYPAAVDVAGAVSLDLPPGGELRDKTIILRPNQTYTIRATIAGPAADSTATLMLASPNGMGLGMNVKYGVTRQFPNSPPGAYFVHGVDRARNLSARQIVNVVNSDVDVILTLRPVIDLDGTVRGDGGKVALDGVRVSLEATGPWGNPWAAVNPDGSFTLRDVQPVNYYVRVKAPAGAYLKSVLLGERSLAAPEIDMTRTSGPLTILLGTDGGKLDGVTAEGVTVVAVPAGRPGDWPELTRSALAGKDGKFELRDLAPGDYQVFAWEDAEPGAPLDPDFRKPFEKLATTVRVSANGHQTLQLKVIK